MHNKYDRETAVREWNVRMYANNIVSFMLYDSHRCSSFSSEYEEKDAFNISVGMEAFNEIPETKARRVHYTDVEY